MDTLDLAAVAPPRNRTEAAKRHPCAITGRQRPRKDLIRLDELRPTLADRIRADHGGLTDDSLIARSEVNRYRNLYLSLIHISEPTRPY